MRHLLAGVLMVGVGLVAPAVPVHAAPARGEREATLTLSSILVTPDGGFVRVTVRGSAAMPAATPVATTEGAPRVFVDLPGVRVGDVPSRVTGSGVVARVRVAQYSLEPLVARIVIDLARPATVALVPGGAATPDLTIVVAPRDTTSSSAPPPPPPPPPPSRAAGVAVPPTASVAAAPKPAVAPVTAPRTAPPAKVVPAPAPVAAAIVAPAAPAPTLAPAPVTAAAPPAAAAPAASPSIQAPAAAAAPAAPATQSTPAPTPSRFSGFGTARGARPSGRVSIYTSAAKATQAGGFDQSYGDIATAVSYQFTERDTDGVEYGLDIRHTAYTIAGRDPRVSVYTGYVGERLADGALRLRAGHLWLDDLGGLGAVAGAQIEGRSGDVPSSGLGRWRGGLFGGLDPDVYTLGYGDGVRKAGGYMALEGAHGRRHVAGYVNIHNGSLTERSVLTVTNFVPAGPVFVYQSAEYDLSPTAGGQGHDGLSYFFSNARISLGPKVEFQGTASRGRSVDTRGLSDDIQAGRAVSQQAIDGLRYQSLGGRATVEVLPRTRVYAGYSRDKNNRDDVATGRWLAGGYGANVLGSGLDVTVSTARTTQATGSYHSTFASVGRELGRRVYATAEFTTALSQIRFVRGDGLVIESKPSTKRFGGNASIVLWRSTSLFAAVERTLDDGYKELRVMTGLTFRLR